MNKYLKEALGYAGVALLFFLMAVNPIFHVVSFLLHGCIIVFGCILVLASLGSISNYFNRNKNEK
jgi:small neutral amino acid transporter SnatA (MarC family)